MLYCTLSACSLGHSFPYLYNTVCFLVSTLWAFALNRMRTSFDPRGHSFLLSHWRKANQNGYTLVSKQYSKPLVPIGKIAIKWVRKNCGFPNEGIYDILLHKMSRLCWVEPWFICSSYVRKGVSYDTSIPLD